MQIILFSWEFVYTNIQDMLEQAWFKLACVSTDSVSLRAKLIRLCQVFCILVKHISWLWHICPFWNEYSHWFHSFLQNFPNLQPIGYNLRASFTTMSRYSICMTAPYVTGAWEERNRFWQVEFEIVCSSSCSISSAFRCGKWLWTRKFWGETPNQAQKSSAWFYNTVTVSCVGKSWMV